MSSARNVVRECRLYWLIMAFMVISVISILGARTANAAAALEIQTETGYGGAVKDGRTFPAKFTLLSPSEDISGDLVVQTANPTGGKDISYVKHVDLPKGTTKVVWMALPGMTMGSNNSAVKFYKGSVSKGEIVPFTKGKEYIQTSMSHAVQVGVLARDPDTFNFLSLLSSKNYNVNVVRLDPAQLPDESAMLDTLDMIAVNDFASDQLKEEQVKAITEWVKRGGTMILSGGAGYTKSAKAFEGLSPVASTGTASLNSMPDLAQAAGKELVFSSPFTFPLRP